MPEADTTPEWLDRDDGHRIAYHRIHGNEPGLIFLGGYMSDMTGTKATRLAAWCKAHGHACVRFDYLGHGQSTGTFPAGTIGRWTDDALAVLDQLTEGPQILVGSSMGGWIMLNLAVRRPRRIHALIGIAAAPDFSQDIWWNLSHEEQRLLETRGEIEIEEDGGLIPVSHAFIEEARRHLVLRRPVRVSAPVRLLQGMRDGAVPWRTALRIAESVTADDVRVHLVKDGDHRLSRDEDLVLLERTIAALLEEGPYRPAS